MLTRLRVEPFGLLLSMAVELDKSTVLWLVPDKICLFDHNKSSQYCSKMCSGDERQWPEFDIQRLISNEVDRFNLYHQLIICLSVIIWMVFLGPWADRRPSARRFIMVITAMAGVLQSLLILANVYFFDYDKYFVLLSLLPSLMLGANLGQSMTTFGYIAATTSNWSRTVRLANFQMLLVIGTSLGRLIGTRIIYDEEVLIGADNHLHNYVLVLIFSLTCRLSALFYILMIPMEAGFEDHDDDKEIILPSDESKLSSGEFTKLMSPDRVKNVKITTPLISKPCSSTSNEDEFQVQVILVLRTKWYQLACEIFQFKNIIRAIKTWFSKRQLINGHPNLAIRRPDSCRHDNSQNYEEDSSRFQLIMLVFSLFLITLATDGQDRLFVEYVKTNFRWSTEFFLNVDGLFRLTSSVASFLVIVILVKIADFSDLSLAIFGLISVYGQNVVLGSLANQLVLFASYIVGSIYLIPAVAVKALASKMVERNEFNRVFGLIAAVEATVPMAGFGFEGLFRLAQMLYSGILFHLTAGILLIPLFVFIKLTF